MPFPFASVLPAVGNLIGGLFDNDNDEDIARWNTDVQRQINQENIAQQSHWNQVSLDEARRVNAENQSFTREMDALNYSRQMDAAQNSILWRVQDAERSGVHPLFALGGAGANISPSMVVGGSTAGGVNASGASVAPQPRQSRSNVSGALGQMGQDISRAVMAMDTREQREAKEELAMYDRTMRHLNVDRALLENDKIRSDIARLQRDQIGSPGAAAGSINRVPSQVVVGSKGQPALEPGPLTDLQHHHQADGGIGIVMSEQMKNRTEDEPIESLGWQWRNRALPFLMNKAPPTPPRHMWPKGAKSMRWQPHRQAFYPEY